MEEVIVGLMIAVGLLILGALLDLANKIPYKEVRAGKEYVWWRKRPECQLGARIAVTDKRYGCLDITIKRVLRHGPPQAISLALGKKMQVWGEADHFYRPIWRIGPMVIAALLGALALVVTGEFWMPVASIIGALIAALVHGLRVPF